MHRFNRTNRTPRPQPRKKEKVQTTPAKTCMIENAEHEGYDFIVPEGHNREVLILAGDVKVFESRQAANSAVFHTMEYLKTIGKKYDKADFNIVNL